MKSLWLFFISLLILKELSCVKFGFIFKDEDEILGQRIVIFGKVPSDLSNPEKAIINDDLNKFHNFYRKNKKSKGSKGRMKLVANLGLNAVNSKGNSQVTVTGELSKFMNQLRLSVLNSLGSADIWKRVKFYSEPVSILSRSDFLRCGPLKDFSQAHAKIEISLNRAVFAKGQILVNQFLWEIDYTMTIQEAAVSGAQYFDISGFVDKEMKYSVLEYYSLDLNTASTETDTGTTGINQSDSKSGVNDSTSDLVEDSDITDNGAANKVPSVDDNMENGVLPSIYDDLIEIDLRSSDKDDKLNYHNHINTSDPEKAEETKETKRDDDNKADDTYFDPFVKEVVGDMLDSPSPSHNNGNEHSDKKNSVDPEANSNSSVIISPVHPINREDSSDDKKNNNNSENSGNNDHNDHIDPNNDEITINILKPRRVRCCSSDCCSVS